MTTREKATYVRRVKEVRDGKFIGPFEDLWMDGRIQEKGNYAENGKNGEFIAYHANGNIKSKIVWSADKMTGVNEFYHGNGKLRMRVKMNTPNSGPPEVEVIYDSLGNSLIDSNGNGPFIDEYEIFELDQKVILTGRLEKFKFDGLWRCKLADGKDIFEERYRDGRWLSGISFIEGRKVKNMMPARTAFAPHYKYELTESQMPSVIDTREETIPLSSNKDDEVFGPVEELASPIGGMTKWYTVIKDNMNSQLKRDGQVHITVRFVVDKTGELTNIEVLGRPATPEHASEAIRLVKMAGEQVPWIPARTGGEPVRMQARIAVTF